MPGNGTCGLQALSGFHAAVQWRKYNSYFRLLQKEIDMWRGYRSHTTERQSWAVSPSFWFGIGTPIHETYHMCFLTGGLWALVSESEGWCHKLCGLKLQKSILSWIWRLGAWSQGDGKAIFLWRLGAGPFLRRGTLRADLGTPSSSAMHLPSSLHGHSAISLCVCVSLSWFLSYCKNAAHWIRALPSLLWAPLISVTPAGNIFSNEVTFTLWQ